VQESYERGDSESESGERGLGFRGRLRVNPAQTQFYSPSAYAAKTGDLVPPKTYQQAMQMPDKAEWEQAMEEEMSSLEQMGVFKLVEPPPGSKVIPCKWVYAYKTDANGVVERHKARVVAKGFHQEEGIDYDEVYAPVSMAATRRTAFAIAAQEGWHLHHIDIKTAFLNGELGASEEVYVSPPPGYDECVKVDGTVWKLSKALYGLKQAPRRWHEKLKERLVEGDFEQSQADPGLFFRKFSSTERSFLLTYVDDMLVFCKDLDEVQAVKQHLGKMFKMHDLGEVTHFLGAKVTRDWERGTISLSMKVKIDELLESFNMTNCQPKATPMERGFVITAKEAQEKGLIEGNKNKGSGVALPKKNRYGELIGSLLYLANSVRPDIALAVGILSRYRGNPTTAHMEAAKRVLAYLKGTSDLELVFGGNQPGMEAFVDANYIDKANVEVFVDADYAGCLDTRKSTSGYVIKVNGGAVHWGSKKQKSVASSTVESEYIAFHAVAKELEWFRVLMRELGQERKSVKVLGDNQGCLSNLRNPIPSSYVKHIDVSYHMVRQCVMAGHIDPEYVPSAQNVADVFTKPLEKAKFEQFRESLGMKRPTK